MASDDPQSQDPAAGQSGAQPGDDEQLFVVDPAEVEAILALAVPAHPQANFTDSEFLELVARSFSITLDEKKEIVGKAGEFSQHQVDELFRILGEERVKFAELNTRHNARMRELQDKHASERAALEAQVQQAGEEQRTREDDERKAEEIRRQMGL